MEVVFRKFHGYINVFFAILNYIYKNFLIYLIIPYFLNAKNNSNLFQN
jgi:hypothetical protein